MPRGNRHHASPLPRCPKCKAETVVPTGPPAPYKGGADRAPAACHTCHHRWNTEHRVLLEAAYALGSRAHEGEL